MAGAMLCSSLSPLSAPPQTCKGGTLSSTEFNSTPFIASVMQEYFLKLVRAVLRGVWAWLACHGHASRC